MSGDDVRAFATRTHDHGEAYETAADISAHAGASDPHSGYQLESEKQANSGYPGLDAAGYVVGNGVSFPASQVASSGANILDDYEEALASGSWTPGITFGGGNSGLGWTASGTYVKMGRLVIAHFVISFSAKGASTGNNKLTGLPFTSFAVTNHGGLFINYFANFAVGVTGISGVVNASATTADLYLDGAGTSTIMTDAHYTNVSYLTGTAVYFASA